MLFHTICSNCNSTIEIARVRMGQMVRCPRCDKDFLAQPATVEDAVIELAMDEPPVMVAMEANTANRPLIIPGNVPGHAPGTVAAKHHLTLPPPPPEEWNASREDQDEEVAGQRYRRFRPHPKDLEEFLDPDMSGGDLSWLMTAGLAFFAIMLVVFLLGLVYILIMR